MIDSVIHTFIHSLTHNHSFSLSPFLSSNFLSHSLPLCPSPLSLYSHTPLRIIANAGKFSLFFIEITSKFAEKSVWKNIKTENIFSFEENAYYPLMNLPSFLHLSFKFSCICRIDQSRIVKKKGRKNHLNCLICPLGHPTLKYFYNQKV